MPIIDKSSRILICDESDLDVACIAKQLEVDGYTRTSIISDPRQILPLLEKHPFDLLLFDIEMSNIDGVELIRSIRQKATKGERACAIAQRGK